MARRGENIFKRKDGRWEARVREYRANKRCSYRSIYGKSYTEVKLKREDYYRNSCFGAVGGVASIASFSHFAERWLAAVRGTVKESTFTRYYRTVYSYILPTLGDIPLSKINSGTVNEFKNELLTFGGRRGRGLSEKTVTDILSVLRQILALAAADGFDTVNLCAIKNPRRPHKEVATASDDEVTLLEEKLLTVSDRISLGILLTLHTGIRNGELCGLRWSDFSFTAQSVRIRRTVERIADLDTPGFGKTKIIIGEPKSANSVREIPLPKKLCEYLKFHSEAENTYILTGTEKPCEPHTLYVRYKRFLSRNGFKPYSFHALRHTFATRGVKSGFDAKALSEILGHSDVTTTLRCYVHPSLEQKRTLMESMFDSEIRGQKYGHHTSETT